MLELGPPANPGRAPIPVSELDSALVAQIVVAWAGEGGEEPRLGWWRTDLVSEFGGHDLFKRLVPATWEWAVLEAVREAARRKDAELRRRGHDPDRILSLYSLGFDRDEAVHERLRDLKQSGTPPRRALPALGTVLGEPWTRDAFLDWLRGHGKAESTTTPTGRRLEGAPPPSLDLCVDRLVAALAPLAGDYPLPHFVRPA